LTLIRYRRIILTISPTAETELEIDMPKNIIEIDSIAIHQDAEGRYSLTDLWRASGSENTKRPSFWLNNKSTQEGVEYLKGRDNAFMSMEENLSKNSCLAPTSVKKGGKASGTYVCKELVYDYAAWLSPEFKFKVYKVFDDYATGKLMELDRKKLRHISSATYKLQSDMVQFTREQDGKVIKSYHFSNEARMVNFVITGSYEGRDRDSLSLDELTLLAKIENRNSVLIGAKIPYEDRKSLLHKEVSGFISAIEPVKKIA
jgi:hypothetical protein